MKESKLLLELCQASSSEVLSKAFRDIIRESFINTMLYKVSELCRSFYFPNPDSQYERGGSANGNLKIDGNKLPIKRPRVKSKDGKEKHLISYQAGKDSSKIKELIIEAIAAGVSTRELNRIYGCSSSSSVSRLWVKEGLKCIEQLRSRELRGENFFYLIIITALISISYKNFVNLQF